MTNILEAASTEDIPRMAQIHVAAFSGDALVAAMFKEKAKLDLQIRQMLKEQIASSEWTVLKATARDKGEMTSWAKWRKLCGTRFDPGHRAEAESQPVDQTGEGRSDLAALSNYMRSKFDRWMVPWTKRKEYLICDSLVTDSHWQGWGFASSTVQRGNNLADAWKLPILAQASPYSYRISKIMAWRSSAVSTSTCENGFREQAQMTKVLGSTGSATCSDCLRRRCRFIIKHTFKTGMFSLRWRRATFLTVTL